MQSVIINFTPTGMIPTKAMTPHVPITPAEIVEQTHAAYEVGITCVHLHARNEQGAPTADPAVYKQIVNGVKKHCPGLVICLSLSGRNITDQAERAAPLQLKPDMASLTLSSLNFNKQASINEPETIKFLTEEIVKCGAKPEFEVFDTGMINYAHYLIKKQNLKPPYYFNFIFGGVATAQLHPVLIEYMVQQLPKQSYAALGGIGDYQLKAHQYATGHGLGIRVGLEDNIFWDSGRSRLATNQELITRIHSLAADSSRPVMSSAEFRALGFSNQNYA